MDGDKKLIIQTGPEKVEFSFIKTARVNSVVGW